MTTYGTVLRTAAVIYFIKYLRSIIQGIGYANEILFIAASLALSLDAKKSSLAQQPPAPQPEAAPANSATTLRANYIRNFRTPTLANLFSANLTNIGNPNLLPETGNSFDVGVNQKLGNFGLLRLTAFQNNITNLVAFQSINPPVNGVSGTWTNIGEVQTQGIEASLNARIAPNVYKIDDDLANNLI